MFFEVVETVGLDESSQTRPALAWGHGRLHLAWCGYTDHRVNLMTSSDDLRFAAKETLPFRTDVSGSGSDESEGLAPAVAATDRALFLAWNDESDGLTLQRRPVSGPPEQVPVAPRQLRFGPGLARWGEEFVLAWRGREGINVSVSGDGVPGPPFLLPDPRTWLTRAWPSEVAVCVVAGQIALAWIGHDHRVNMTLGRGGEFEPRTVLPFKAGSSPAAAAVGDQLVLAWREKRGAITVLAPFTGLPPAALDVTSAGAPALCADGETLYLACQRTGLRRRLQVARLALRSS
jgi:hypothetical protein